MQALLLRCHKNKGATYVHIFSVSIINYHNYLYIKISIVENLSQFSKKLVKSEKSINLIPETHKKIRPLETTADILKYTISYILQI